MQKRSFFIGIWIPSHMKQGIDVVQHTIKAMSDMHIRCVDLASAHLTFQFLGARDEIDVPFIIERLSQIQQKSFQITTGTHLDLFLKRDHAVVYIPFVDSPELTDFIDQVHSALHSIISFDSQKYHAHVTVARVHDIKNKLEYAQRIKMIQIPQMCFLVDSFELIESVRSEHGVKYNTRASFSLQ